jgi:hypothetical protein
MTSEPSIRTGLTILSIGVALILLGIIFCYFPTKSMEQLSSLLELSMILYSDVGPGVVSWGIGWIISALNHLRKFYLIPISVGMILPMLTISFGSPLIDLDSWGSISWHTLIFSIPPALISSGIVSGVIINRHIKRDKLLKIYAGFEEYLLYIVAVGFFLPFIREPLALLRLMSSTIGCWIIWHFLSPKIAYYSLTKKIKNSKGRIELISSRGISEEELTFSNIFSRAYHPLAFGLGVSFTLLSIIELAPISESIFTSEPLMKTAQIAIISILAVTVGSSYVGPVVWLFKDSNIRIKDSIKIIIEEPKIHSLANQLVEVYTFLQAPISFTVVATGRDYMYAFALLAMLIMTVLTVAFSTTILYIKFSAKKSLHQLTDRLLKEGYLNTLP